MLILPRGLTQQPRHFATLNPRWAGRSLNFCGLPMAGLSLFDAKAGQMLAPVSSASISAAFGAGGSAINGSSNTSAGYYIPAATFGTSFTHLIVADGLGTGFNQGFTSHDTAAAGDRHWSFFVLSNGFVRFVRFDTSNNAYQANTSDTLSAAQRAAVGVYVARCNGANTQVWAPCGTGTGTITGTPSTPSSSATDFQLRGTTLDPTADFPIGNIYLAVTFNAALSDGEVGALRMNPWQIFASPYSRTWSPYIPPGPVGTLGQFDPELRIAAWF